MLIGKSAHLWTRHEVGRIEFSDGSTPATNSGQGRFRKRGRISPQVTGIRGVISSVSLVGFNAV